MGLLKQNVKSRGLDQVINKKFLPETILDKRL